MGTRDDAGVWTPEQAKRLIDYTKSVGGHIAAAEFMNEPTFAAMGGAPAGYDAAAYGRDFKVFRAFVKEAVPDMLILGPGSVGETTGEWGVAYSNAQILKRAICSRPVDPERSTPSLITTTVRAHCAVPPWACLARRWKTRCRSNGFSARTNARVLPSVAGRIRPGQTVLEHRDGWMRHVAAIHGRNFYRYVPLS